MDDKTSHTPFDDMLEPQGGPLRPWNWLHMRRMLSPISTYGLTFALGAAFVFLGASAMRRTLPTPVMPTPLPTAVAKISIEPGPAIVTSPSAYPTLAPTPPVVIRQVIEPTPKPVEVPMSVQREALVARPAAPRPTPVPRRRVTPPRRIEALAVPLPEIRIPQITPRRIEPPQTPQARYYPEFDPVREANEERRDFDGNFEEYPPEPEWNEEGDDRHWRRGFRERRWEDGEARERHLGPRDNELGEWDDDDYSGRAWGRAGGRGRKWKQKWGD